MAKDIEGQRRFRQQWGFGEYASPIPRRQGKNTQRPLWNEGPTRKHYTKTAQDIANLNRGLQSFKSPKVDDRKRGAGSPLGGQAKETKAGFKDAWAKQAQALRKYEGR